MRNVLFWVVVGSVLLLFGSGIVFADDEQHARTIDAILSDIRTEQNVQDNSAINPDKVSDNLLEELGDAVMSSRQPNEEQHEWMDNMMGGEGSESLRAAHIRMGYNYLLGETGRYRSGRGGMMGDSYMSPMMGYSGRYGRDFSYFHFFPLGWIVVALIVAGGGVAAIILFGKSGRKTETPVDVLKLRLARGEISVEEFNKLKDHL